MNIQFFRRRITVTAAEDTRKTQLYVAERERDLARSQHYSIEELHRVARHSDGHSRPMIRRPRAPGATQRQDEPIQLQQDPVLTVSDLEQMASAGGRIFSVGASDKYGDYGIVGMAISPFFATTA